MPDAESGGQQMSVALGEALKQAEQFIVVEPASAVLVILGEDEIAAAPRAEWVTGEPGWNDGPFPQYPPQPIF
jgi:hypothetical protein